ncbi:unnamed protein product [Microthlaspi erraticum]|uniref:Uncharacterized protein n=1 Tax=Microthlaspi erraticum TaxID=1685480 RepID=A0A6D2HK54_9BRAS|nr:unnamed protein product [Microthlaspi erraticum]
MKAAKPNLARSAPALGLNCADWASKTASGRPRRSDGRSGRSAGQSGLGESERSWPDDFTVGRLGRRMDLADGFSAGRGTSSRLGRMHRPWYANGLRGREACFPARALGRARRGVTLAWPTAGQCFPGRMRDRPDGLDFGRDFSRTYGFGRARNIRSSASRTARSALILDMAVWSSLHSFGYNSFSTHPNRPFQLRWKVNSIRARRELVLMKSIE